jgi:hypothetical protein
MATAHTEHRVFDFVTWRSNQVDNTRAIENRENDFVHTEVFPVGGTEVFTTSAKYLIFNRHWN